MLLDGYWKKDLNKIIRKLTFWGSHKFFVLHDLAEHKINQGFLYSAVIIRKIIDDEKEANDYFKNKWDRKSAILDHRVSVRFYYHVNPKKDFMNSKLFLSDYDTKNSQEQMLPIKKICNQFIHSYVWGIVHDTDMKKIFGAIFASDNDKEKGAYLIKIEDWINTIQFIIDH